MHDVWVRNMGERIMDNPIAGLLNIEPRDASRHNTIVDVDGVRFSYQCALLGTCEAIYRLDLEWGVLNPAFSLRDTPTQDHAMMLGQYLAKSRRGRMKREEAEARVMNAFVTVVAP